MNDDLHSRLHALGDSPDLNRPVADLDVVLRRARARRQRSGRMLAGSLAVALVVAGTAAALPRLANDPQPAVDTVSPDAPAACKVAPSGLAELDNELGEETVVTTTIEPTSLVAPTSGKWQVDVATEIAALFMGPQLGGLTYGTTVALVQDDAVVAVMDTYAAPTVGEAQQMAVDAVPQPTPLLTELDAQMISCLTGEPAVLKPGSYQLVATVTAAFASVEAPAGWSEAAIVRRTSAPVDVTVFGDSAPADALACGAPDDELRSLSDPQQNPAPLRLTVDDAPASVATGDDLRFTTTVHNDGASRIGAFADPPRAVVTRDSVIVGGLEPTEDVALDIDLDPGASTSFDTWTGLLACAHSGESAAALPPGSYELWTVGAFTPRDPSGAASTDLDDWQGSGGPWPFEIGPAPVSGESDPAGDAMLTCAMSTDDLTALAASTAQSTLTLTRAKGFDAETMATRITNEGDEAVELAISTVSGGVARADRVVGVGQVTMWDTAPTMLEPGDSRLVTALGPAGASGCDGALPGGPYDGWTMVTVFADGKARPLVVGPIDITLPASSGDLIDGYRCGATDHLLTSDPLADQATFAVEPRDLPTSLPSGEAFDLDVRLSSVDGQATPDVGKPVIYLVQDGLIVAEDIELPLPQIGSIEQGGHLDTTVHSPVTACTGPGAPLPPGPLPAGHYELFVSTMPTTAGPWPLTITDS